MTLPLDVIEWLRRLNQDPGWAIVALHAQHEPAGSDAAAVPVEPRPAAELVDIDRRHALIVVDRQSFRSLPGVALVPLADTRAFLAMDPDRGLPDLELAVIDRLEEATETSERRMLSELRSILRAWRRGGQYRFHLRSIIVAERTPRRRGR